MDNQKIGNFIAELRKSKNMTQKELAEKLNVTDKAVSKWERGVGYPEITITPLLAELLGVSVNELLLGEHVAPAKEKDSATPADHTDTIISDVVEYVEKTKMQKTERANNLALLVLSSAFLIAIFVCMLCNYVTSRTFSWSLYVVGSEAAVWLIAAPFFLIKKHRFVVSMATLTVAIAPLLLLIEYLCPNKNWVIPFALPITIVTIASLWVSVLLFAYTKIDRLYLISLMFILYGIIINVGINSFVSSYLNFPRDNISVSIVAISSGFVAIVLTARALLHKKNNT